jgi:Methylamine utilisation protein MauE
MAITFGFSAFSKIKNGAAFAEFATWLGGVPPVSRRTQVPFAAILVAGELVVAGAVIAPGTVEVGFLLAALLLTVFAAGIYAALRGGVRAPCRCFGASTAPLGWSQIVRNALLALVAVTGAITQGSHGGVTVPGVILSLATAALLVVPVIFYDDLAFLLQRQAPTP